MDTVFNDAMVEDFAEFVRSKGGKLIGYTKYAKGKYVFDVVVPKNSPVSGWSEQAFDEYMKRKSGKND